MKNKALLWLMVTLSLCLSGASLAQVEVDLTNTEGIGISEHLIQVNNIVVHTEVDDAQAEGGKRTIAVPYNITFRFDPNTLHLIPVFPSEPAAPAPNGDCANLTVKVLENGDNTALAGSNVTINQQTLVTDENGEVTFEGLPPERTIINITLAGYFSTSQMSVLSCSNPTLVIVKLIKPFHPQPNPGFETEPSPPDTGTNPVIPPNPPIEPPNSGGSETEEPTVTPPTPSEPEQPDPEPPVDGPDITDVTPSNTIPQEVKIVLDWGEVPRDLDAHLTGPDPFDQANRFHVFFDNTAVEGAWLEIDSFSSVTKPEIVYIKPIRGTKHIQPGRYRYTVHQFAGVGSIAESVINVEVWVDGELQETFQPSGNAADLGGMPTDIWQVFEIIVDGSGRLSFLPLRSYANGVNPYEVR